MQLGEGSLPGTRHGLCLALPSSWLWVDEQNDKGEDGDSAWGFVQQWKEQELLEITEHFSVAGVGGT